MTAKEFADSIKARLTLPSEPHRPRNLYEKTDVAKTWALFRTPEQQKLRRAK